MRRPHVTVDLDDFDTQDIVEHLESKGYAVVKGKGEATAQKVTQTATYLVDTETQSASNRQRKSSATDSRKSFAIAYCLPVSSSKPPQPMRSTGLIMMLAAMGAMSESGHTQSRSVGTRNYAPEPLTDEQKRQLEIDTRSIGQLHRFVIGKKEVYARNKKDALKKAGKR